LRILLVARQDLTASGTAQTNRLLRALLLWPAATSTVGSLAASSPTSTLPSLARHRHPASTSTNRVAPLGDSGSDLRL
jgi:hypothetical protein